MTNNKFYILLKKTKKIIKKMKKNLHNQSNNHNYFQNNLVLSSAAFIGNNPSNSGVYQQSSYNNNNYNNQQQQHILPNQQFYYPNILAKNNNRNTSQRPSFNGNHFEKIHYNNNNNMGAGSSNFQIPQQFNNNNYHYSANPQMIYTNERRHSYNSISQQQQHQQQQQQQQQTVLSNLSNNQNYSKRNTNNYKSSFQKQMSLPEQTINEITEQIKSVSLSSPQSPNLNKIQSVSSNSESDSEKQTTKSATFTYLSPVYENNLEIKDEQQPANEDVFYGDDDDDDENMNDDDDVIHVIEENEETAEININSSTSSEISSPAVTTNVNINNQNTICEIVEQQIENYKDKNEYLRYLISRYPDSKWPLHSTWTFWFIKHDSNKTWSDNLKTIIDISYVEDFWSTTTYLLNIPNLINQGDLTFFKKGIKPEWEDEQNKSGGCWLYQMNNQSQQYKKIDDLFMETLLALIGDNYCDSDLINKIDKSYFEKKNTTNNDHICDFLSGTILMHRGKNDKLALWTKNYKDDITTRLIGKIWKNVMKVENVTINFEVF
jgi:hypothetical protein